MRKLQVSAKKLKPALFFKVEPQKTIKYMFFSIVLLITLLLYQEANLQEQRKQTVAQGSFCIKNTADVTANYQLALIREQDAHKRDIDEANKKLEFLVNEYNKLLVKAKKAQSLKQDSLDIYSYRIYPSLP